jgi:6-phosphofructokinase 1
MPMKTEDFDISSLGNPDIVSPLLKSKQDGGPGYRFVTDGERIVYDVSLENFRKCSGSGEMPLSFEKAGPREKIFFEPAKTRAAIVTCGGRAPG